MVKSFNPLSFTYSPVLCIVGPTATGKSDISQDLALYYDGEIVSADSMQIYKGMDIGTAKLPPDERIVRHYGLDLVDPGEPYSASLFQEYARGAFDEIEGRGKRSLLVGGTGFYIQAAIDDYNFPKGEQTDNPVRSRYQYFLMEYGNEALWDRLYELDRRSAEAIHPNNAKRVIRALEMHDSGISYADQVDNLKKINQLIPAVFIGLNMDRAKLYDRINKRVDIMREQGLVDEVESLLDKGFREGLCAKQAIGYKEIVHAIEGEYDLDFAFEEIKKASRRYAKRQCSWFNRDDRITWIDITDLSRDSIVEKAIRSIETVKTD